MESSEPKNHYCLTLSFRWPDEVDIFSKACLAEQNFIITAVCHSQFLTPVVSKAENLFVVSTGTVGHMEIW